MFSISELLALILDAVITIITSVLGDFLIGDILRGILFPLIGA